MTGWHGPVARIGLVRAEQLGGPVLDIRQDAEYASGHIPGAAHVELGSLVDGAGVVGPGPLAVMCGHGERAMSAASLLAASGHTDLTVVLGGPADWSKATGRPLETGR
jgi:rhodanese-related sulfurtransferase